MPESACFGALMVDTVSLLDFEVHAEDRTQGNAGFWSTFGLGTSCMER